MVTFRCFFPILYRWPQVPFCRHISVFISHALLFLFHTRHVGCGQRLAPVAEGETVTAEAVVR